MAIFNAVQKRSLDTLNYTSNHRANATKAINTGMLEYILCDPFRDCFPQTQAYTWRKWARHKDTKNQKSTLDYFLINVTFQNMLGKSVTPV